MGRDLSTSYVVAYLVEESLSVDNLFVFLIIFSYAKLSESRQHRVLFWGVAKIAVVMRAIFIFAGSRPAAITSIGWPMCSARSWFTAESSSRCARKKRPSTPKTT